MGEYELRNAYENTLLDAAKSKEGTGSYNCAMILCRDCPFYATMGHCTDETLQEGAGYKRTVQGWQQWWYEQTGERDTRTREQILSPVDSSESGEDSVDTDTRGEDTLQPVQPTVDITWTTATGKMEQHTGPMSLLSGEMDRFRRELSVWLEAMNRPVEQTPNSLAENISFLATDAEGCIIAKVELFAEQFGKSKQWRSLEK